MSTEFSDIDHSNGNAIPPDHDLPRLRSLRKECEAEMDSINEQIDRLVEQRKLVEARLKRYDTLLAPIKRVPADVLSTIFELITDVETRGRDLPTVLPSRICKTWRNLAIELPTLWSTIRISPPDHPCISPYGIRELRIKKWEEQMKWLLHILSLWITRSKESPLSISVDLRVTNNRALEAWRREDPPISIIPFYKDLVHLVCSVSHRWNVADLDILTVYPDIVSEFHALQPEGVPLLTKITFRWGGCNGSNIGPPFNPTGILAATSLRSATIVSLDRPWHELSMQWAGLRELQLGVRTLEDNGEGTVIGMKALGRFSFLGLMSMCPNLKRCRVAVQSEREEPREWQIPAALSIRAGKPVELSRLNSFTFYGEHPEDEVMASLDLPSLTEFQFRSSPVVETGDEDMIMLSHRFMQSIGRFGSQLTNIRFNFLLLLGGVDSVARCLKALHNLQGLQLDDVNPFFQHISEEIGRRFEPASTLLLTLLTLGEEGSEQSKNPQNPPLCPLLERFACELLKKGFSERQLLEFILRRSGKQEGVSRIKEVEVAFATIEEMDLRKELEDSGFDLGRLSLRVKYPDVY